MEEKVILAAKICANFEYDVIQSHELEWHEACIEILNLGLSSTLLMFIYINEGFDFDKVNKTNMKKLLDGDLGAAAYYIHAFLNGKESFIREYRPLIQKFIAYNN